MDNTLSNISANPAYGITRGKESKSFYTSINIMTLIIDCNTDVSINPAYGTNTGRRYESIVQ